MSITILPEHHRDRLQKLAAAKGANLEAILIVPSMTEWCARHGLSDRDTHCAKSVCLQNSDKWLIVLPAEITPEMQSQVLSVLYANGFTADCEQLEDPDVFLTHLFLHELAHTLFPNASEEERDEWAFGELSEEDPPAPRG